VNSTGISTVMALSRLVLLIQYARGQFRRRLRQLGDLTDLVCLPRSMELRVRRPSGPFYERITRAYEISCSERSCLRCRDHCRPNR
jgi:hypothetical protein